jgi:hypothetical protein
MSHNKSFDVVPAGDGGGGICVGEPAAAAAAKAAAGAVKGMGQVVLKRTKAAETR